MAEDLIAGFLSPNMQRGLLRGYGIYITSHRVIGVKGGWKQRFGVLLGASVRGAVGAAVFGPGFAGASVALGTVLGEQLSMDKATKLLEKLEKKKDFEVRREELEEVKIRYTRKWFGSGVLFHCG